MITNNVSTLKIHKLTQAQYDRELIAGNIDDNALYLTPDDTQSQFDELANNKANVNHTHTVANISDLTATAKELNYMDGVTSNVQTQIDTVSKNLSTHTNNADIHFTATERTKLAGIATGATKVTVDNSLSSTSTNPVQNKIINGAFVDLTSAVSANTSSISTHTQSIASLQSELDSYEEITSSEITALFSA